MNEKYAVELGEWMAQAAKSLEHWGLSICDINVRNGYFITKYVDNDGNMESYCCPISAKFEQDEELDKNPIEHEVALIIAKRKLGFGS